MGIGWRISIFDNQQPYIAAIQRGPSDEFSRLIGS
jgi:hypothetical protein